MKRLNKFLTLFLTFILSGIISVSLFACTKTYKMNYFNTSVTIATDKDISANSINKIRGILDFTDNTFSTVIENSEIYKINNAKAGEEIQVNGETFNLLTLSKNYSELTGGYFNIGALPLSKLWCLSVDTFNKEILTEEPPIEKIDEAKSHVNNFNDKFVLDNGKIKKTDDKSMLDLGGIAKGYSVDKITDVLKNDGITKGYVNVGGSSLYIFKTEEDLSVLHPRKSDYIMTISNKLTENCYISTSGDYQRYYELKGKRYCHILDTSIGKPIDNGIESVTVITTGNSEYSSATFTDMASTAIMAMGLAKAKEFIKTVIPNFKVFIVYENNGIKKIFTNQTVNKDFKILDSDYTAENF